MRLESATVPAAVMPDHARHDDGLRNTCHCGPEYHGKASLNRDKSEDLPVCFCFKSFREKKPRIITGFHDINSPGSIKMKDQFEKIDILYCTPFSGVTCFTGFVV